MSRSRTLYRDRETFPRHTGKRGPNSLDGDECELREAKRLARARVKTTEAIETLDQEQRT